MLKDLQDDEVEHTSSLQRWEVASESNALPCQGSYFRLRSLFCDLLTGILLYFGKEKKKIRKKEKRKKENIPG